MEYSELYQYFKVNENSLYSEMDALERIFSDAREPKNSMKELFRDSSVVATKKTPLPIYLTRSRIKSIDSAFLKTKRKDKSRIEDITDIIGVRVLCLFNQDISYVYKFILELFDNEIKYKLNEINIYGWENTSIFKTIFESFSFDMKIYNPDEKPTGYKSIHFSGTINSGKTYNFEIQLRTLLQDVWGEMSHKIAYKQKGSYSYVNNSFNLLARDLETNDLLLAQLKAFTSEKICLENDNKFNLRTVFEYESEKLPVEFLKEGQLNKEYQKYTKIVYENWMTTDEVKLNNAYKAYEDLATLYVKNFPSKRNNKNFQYWEKMEEAFYNLAHNNIQEAEHYYMTLPDSYVASFRLGQIAVHQGDFVLAMRYFDNCKLIAKKSKKMIGSNMLKVHINMSIIFWSYGEEYLLSAIEEIEDAINIIVKDTYIYKNPEKMTVYNAACWYYIEHCNLKYTQDTLDKAEEYYNELLKITEAIEAEAAPSTKNTYDTLAWYNYSRFVLSGEEDTDFLKKAKQYIDKLDEINSARVNSKSDRIIHNTHEQEINCAYEKFIAEI